MHFPDLTQYAYEPLKDGMPVLNVGWLGGGNSFPVGALPPDFLHTLKRISRQCRANQSRGTHACEYCSDPYREIWSIQDGGAKRLLGSAELWIPSPDQTHIYAAPDLIIHYVDEHQYKPPAEFVLAVTRFDPDSPWDGKVASIERLR